MAARITVDPVALRSAGAEVEGMAGALEQRRGALVGPLVSVQTHLSGSACGDVHGDLVVALGGLAEGLEHVASTLRYGLEHERAGEMIHGAPSHSDVLTMGSTAWENVLGVVRGTQVTPHTPPTVTSTRVVPIGPFTWVDRELAHPYEDPDFPGAPSVAVP